MAVELPTAAHFVSNIPPPLFVVTMCALNAKYTCIQTYTHKHTHTQTHKDSSL